MHFIIAGGTGLIGKRLVEFWLKQGHTISIISRTQSHIEETFATSVKAITWDKLTSADLQGADAVINLTGANIAQKRWNESYKKEMIESRTNSTKKLISLLMELPQQPPALFNASAVGIYGWQTPLPDRLPPRLDETTQIDFEHPADFLSQVAGSWEKAAEPAVSKGLRVVFLRFAIVLASEGGALPMIMKPFQYYAGGPIGTGNQPFSWVSISDVVRAIDFLVSQPEATGPYNIVAGCIQEKVLAETIARILNRPDVVKVPAFVLKMAMGEEMARELLLEGQRAYAKRLLDAGFKFSYSDIESALHHILQDQGPTRGQPKPEGKSMMSKIKNMFGKK